MFERTPLASLCALFVGAALSKAAVTIDPGVTEVFAGTASVQIPVAVFGGDAVSDLVGAVRVAGAPVTAVAYEGSIWDGAAGGFLSFFPGFAPPGETVDPNASLLLAGETVAANGTLFTLTVDTSGLSAGTYPITLRDTAAGSTQLYTSGGVEVTTNVLSGSIRIVDKPVSLWRTEQFGADAANTALEATLWGDDADPDQDGRRNLLEFAFLTNPNLPDFPETQADSPGIPTLVEVSDGGETYRGIRYTRRIDRPCHTVDVGTGTDLATWEFTAANGVVEVDAEAHANGLTETVTARLPDPLPSAPERQFLTLRVTSSE